MYAAGLAGLVAPTHMQGVQPKSGQLPVPAASKKPQQNGDAPASPLTRPVIVAATTTAAAAAANDDNGQKAGNRWTRRQKSEGTWTTVVRKNTPEVSHSLVDEWTALVVSELTLGKKAIASLCAYCF